MSALMDVGDEDRGERRGYPGGISVSQYRLGRF